MYKLIVILFAIVMLLGCSNSKVVKHSGPKVIHQIVDADGENVIAWTIEPDNTMIIRIDGTLACRAEYIKQVTEALLKPMPDGMTYQIINDFDFGPSPDFMVVDIGFGQTWQHQSVPVTMSISYEDRIVIIFSVGSFSLTVGADPATIMSMLADGWTLE